MSRRFLFSILHLFAYMTCNWTRRTIMFLLTLFPFYVSLKNITVLRPVQRDIEMQHCYVVAFTIPRPIQIKEYALKD